MSDWVTGGHVADGVIRWLMTLSEHLCLPFNPERMQSTVMQLQQQSADWVIRDCAHLGLAVMKKVAVTIATTLALVGTPALAADVAAKELPQAPAPT